MISSSQRTMRWPKPGHTLFLKAQADGDPACLAGIHLKLVIGLRNTQGDIGGGEPFALFSQLDDGGKDTAFGAFPVAGIKEILLAMDERGQGGRQMRIAAGQNFEGHADLLQPRLKTRLKQVVGETAWQSFGRAWDQGGCPGWGLVDQQGAGE